MKVRAHIISSAVLAVIVFALFRQWSVMLITFLTGVFVDLDHLFDFWIGRPQNPFSIKAFLSPHSYMKKQNKAFVPLHGYEFILILCLLAWQLNWQPLLIGAAASLTLHLILDDYGNKLKTFSYFIIYRVAKKFQVFRD